MRTTCSTRAVVLMTGNPRVEEVRKNLPRRYLSTLHRELISMISRCRGIDLIIASDEPAEFRLEGPAGSSARRCESLGQRLENVFGTARTWGYETIVVLAGDVAGLSPDRIRQAFDAMETSDCVVAPSRDGGFSLVGLRMGADIDWHRIPWFSDRAADGLREEFDRNGLVRSELPAIDDIDDRSAATRAAHDPLLDSRVRTTLLGLIRDRVPSTGSAVTPSSLDRVETIRLRAPPAN